MGQPMQITIIVEFLLFFCDVLFYSSLFFSNCKGTNKGGKNQKNLELFHA